MIFQAQYNNHLHAVLNLLSTKAFSSNCVFVNTDDGEDEDDFRSFQSLETDSCIAKDELRLVSTQQKAVN